MPSLRSHPDDRPEQNSDDPPAGRQAMQFSVGARYWAEAPDTGPDGWGARLVVTLLFPK